MKHQYTNALINETSPYLLQHAHNPVNWLPWGNEALKKAKEENKPLLISIGYAACHWCHVMEEECFENDTVAQYMNKHFVNIKIDREERPDVDQIYMDALQLMSGNGGWPLNIVALPDGKPFWGATYLPKNNWLQSLEKLVELYQKEPATIIDYAEKLEQSIRGVNLIDIKSSEINFRQDEIDLAVKNWSQYFDTFLGGYKRAPKFMMPNNLEFLLHYGHNQKNDSILEYVNTTLTRMANGGIFDHLGGGFSRYSVDEKWHVPHFEKMLYDNGQLISLYSKAYAVTNNPLYKETVEKTITFCIEELLDNSGGFYASLDADSKNDKGKLEEGAFYIWKEEELKQLLQNDYPTFKTYFNINSYGLWEHGNYVLIKDKSDTQVADQLNISISELQATIDSCIQILKKARNKRTKPRLDDKILTSWNGLMLTGLAHAYRYLGNDSYLDLANSNATFLVENMKQKDGGLYRNHKNGFSNISGFLDDYATVIEGLLALYEVTFDERWLMEATSLTDYALKHFSDSKTQMLFYTSDNDDQLIRRSFEIGDNVISSSNSIMACNLYRLHKLFPEKGYKNRALKMLENVQENFVKNAQGYANWMRLTQWTNENFYEIAVVGDQAQAKGKKLGASYIPNSIFTGTTGSSELELLANRKVPDNTLIYVCIEGACKLPTEDTEVALSLIK